MMEHTKREEPERWLDWTVPQAPPLRPDTVDVWCATLEWSAGDIQRLDGWLSPAERIRATKFRFDRDRRRFVARRGVLRLLLASYLSIQPDRIAFAYGASGKPSLAAPLASERISFNAAHSHERALIAITRGRAVGVDIERIRPMPDADDVARRFFSGDEVAALNSLEPSARLAAFFSCWTRKEACVKSTGEGLSRPLHSFSIPIVPGAYSTTTLLARPDGTSARLMVRGVVPSPGYLGAVAADGSAWGIRCWRWDHTIGLRSITT